MTEFKLVSRLRFDDLEVILHAAVAGMGIAWLPHWILREQIRTGALVVLWEDRPAALSDSYAIWPATEHLPSRVRLAIDTLVERLPDAIGTGEPSNAGNPEAVRGRAQAQGRAQSTKSR